MIKSFASALILMLFCGQLFALPESIELEVKINETIDDLAHLDSEKTQLEQSIQDLESKIRERKKIINQRVRALSYMQRFQWGGLLSADEPYQVERNLKVVERLNKYDLSLFKEFKTSLKSLALARNNLSETQKQLKSIIANLQKQQSQLAVHDRERKEQLTASNTNSLLKMKGELTRPLVSTITLPYGARSDKQNQYVLISKGLVYNTERSQPIKAVGPGVVIFRDRVPHWRETLIVQHDDNYYSVYAGIQADENKVQMGVGQKVEKDETVGLTDGKEFYFELRHFENPINPALWFKESL